MSRYSGIGVVKPAFDRPPWRRLSAALLAALLGGVGSATADPADAVASAQAFIAHASSQGDTSQFEEYAMVHEVRGSGCRSTFQLQGQTSQGGAYGLSVQIDWSRISGVAIRLDSHTVSIDGPMTGISTVEPDRFEDIRHFHFSYASIATAGRVQEAMEVLRKSCGKPGGTGL